MARRIFCEDREINGVKIRYTQDLLKNLDILKKTIKRDWDHVIVIDGIEGSGKSVLAQQVAWYLTEGQITIENIVWTPDQFTKKVLSAEKYTCIIWDEARGGLSARNAMTYINKTITDMLAEIRQKNLFILIILPTFFDLDKNVALWRSRFLIHVTVKGEFERGNYCFYNFPQKKWLYVYGKRWYNYGSTKPSFYGVFRKGYVVNEDDYRRLKYENLRADKENVQLNMNESRWRDQRNIAVKEMVGEKWNKMSLMERKLFADKMLMSTKQVKRILKGDLQN